MIYGNSSIKPRMPNARRSSAASPILWSLALLLTMAMLTIASGGSSGVPVVSANSLEIVSVTLGEGKESSTWFPEGPGQRGPGHNDRVGIRQGPNSSEPLTIQTPDDIPVLIKERYGTWKATEWQFENDNYTEAFTCVDTKDYLGNAPKPKLR